MKKTPIIILGSSGLAREVLNWINHDQYEVVAFYSEEAKIGETIFGVPVVNEFNGLTGFKFVIGVGDPILKKKLWSQAVVNGLFPSRPIIHWSAIVGAGSIVGDGSVICPNVVVTSKCTIGDGVLLNLNSTVGHDTVIGDFCTVNPGANISGNVTIWPLCLIGTNACVIEKKTICHSSIVGAGAVVVKDVEAETVVVGNPASVLRQTKS